MQPDPLTRCNQDGVTYQRTPEVEAQILKALAVPLPILLEQAGGRSPADPAHLREECLVYLIRHFHRHGNVDAVRDLTNALLQRCATRINRQLTSLRRDLAEEGFHAVVEQLLTRILTLDSDRGDFLQVRFWPTMNYLIIDEFRRLASEQKHADDTVTLSTLAGYDVDDGNDAHSDERHLSGSVQAVAPVRLSPEVRALCREALHLLQPQHRDAFVLYHYSGWPIESNDPAVQTLSGLFQKSPRTIRHWLNQAEKVLEEWRGESNE